MSDPNLFGTVISQLPKDVELRYISAHVRIRGAPNSSWGETYLLLHKGDLVLLTRTSVFDGYQALELSQTEVPKLIKGASQSDLYLKGGQGEDFRLPISPNELDPVMRLLSKHAATDGP